MSIVHRIVTKVAQREGVDPTDIKPTLNEVVDIEALEALSTNTESRSIDPYPLVEFLYHGYAVTVNGDGSVQVDEDTSISEDASNTSDSNTAESGDRERAMTTVADIIGARDRPFIDRLDRLLQAVTEILGTESATLSYVDGETYVLEAVAGTVNADIQPCETVPLVETVCKRAIETEQALVLNDIEAEAPELADSTYDVSSYIGVPVFVDGEVYGTLCFYSTNARAEEFTDWNLALVELMSYWVSAELEQREQKRAFHATTTNRPYGVS